MTKQISLTQGKFAIVDDDNYNELSSYNWYCSHGYAVRTIGRTPTMQTIRMHNVVANPPTGMFVDHIDGNKLNNCKNNLRFCTQQQNVHNGKKYSHGTTSEYKGVSWDSWRKKWRASIVHNMHQIFIGRYGIEIDAAIAYDKKAKELFGEFARTNF